jgi:hypothetical protein
VKRRGTDVGGGGGWGCGEDQKTKTAIPDT